MASGEVAPYHKNSIMDVTAVLIAKAAATAFTVLATWGTSIGFQPTIYANTAQQPTFVTVFYDQYANQLAHRWQSTHWKEFRSSVLVSNGSIEFDRHREHAILVTAHDRARGPAETRYAIPYEWSPGHIDMFPIMVMEHQQCRYLAQSLMFTIVDHMQDEIAQNVQVTVSVQAPSAEQDATCNPPRSA